MKSFLRSARRQGGAVLIVLMTVMVLGIAWYTVGALGRAAPSVADKEILTAAALQKAKRALLDYVAKEAADPSSAIPGRMPCPEPLSPPAGQEGIAAGLTCVDNTATYLGRLPWRTLGVDQIRDGYGEPLWYILGRDFRQSPINFGTISEIDLDGVVDQAVALILAPGAALNTISEPGAPPAACPRVNQLPRPLAAPFDPARFLECGRNTTPAPGNDPEYVTTNTAPWTNDRLIAISAAELMDAIAGPIADRLQRQVAPAMNDFHNITSLASWGERFLPHASTMDSGSSSTWPNNNNRCGNHDVRAGMPPTATVASGTCNTNWTGGSASGLGGLLNFGSCVPGATHLQCDFTVILGGVASPSITANASRIGNSFRSFDQASIQISVNGGSWQTATVQNYSGNVSSGSSNATVQFEIVFPLLSIADNVVVRMPHPTDALLPDARVAWFLNNNWDRHTYYVVARANTVDPGGDDCDAGNQSECLRVNGMLAPTNNKRLVLVLMGPRPLPGQTWPSGDRDDYMEGENADDPSDRVFETQTVSASFNDRVAACPFEYPISGGGTVTLCNW